MEKAITEQQPPTKSRHQTALKAKAETIRSSSMSIILVYSPCLKATVLPASWESAGTEFYDLSGKTQKHVLVRFVYICVLVFMLCKRGNIKECAQNPQEANSPHVSLKPNGNDSVGQTATLIAACCA
jgi:hypothetical protein